MSLMDHTGLVSIKDLYKHRLFNYTVDGHISTLHNCVLLLMEYCAPGP
jgi:hypothetical protein